jgi:deoxyribose-phosphate aldolase
MYKNKFSSYLELMLLDPDISLEKTLIGCQAACQYQLKSVFVKPCFLHQAAEYLREKNIHLGTVIGFPHGSNTTHVKLYETKRALMEGAQILELVINTGDVKNHSFDKVKKEVQTIGGLTHMNYGEIRLVLETGLLMLEQIVEIGDIATDVKVNGLVTSTGFVPQKDHYEIIKSLTGHVSEGILIKAMSKNENIEDFEPLINAGYNRIGIFDLEKI